MKEKPILFSGAMVRAILDGRKTQTRRIVKNHPLIDAEFTDEFILLPENHVADDCPYGKVGDRLWVRETCQAWEYELSGEDVVRYVADGAFRPIEPTQNAMERWIELNSYRGKKGAIVPSIHMPRWASRILLEITDVRVERLNDISEEDAIKEGIEGCVGEYYSTEDKNPEKSFAYADGRGAFKHLWESTYGLASWEDNPWVWAIDFKAVQ